MAAKTILSDVCEYKRGGEFYLVRRGAITVEDGWNPRKRFDGIEELAESIRNNGILQPLIVKKLSNKTLVLRSGERRIRAVDLLESQGVEIWVPVLVKSNTVNDADLLVGDVNSNGGEPYLPTEEAAAFKRLVAYGFNNKEIAENTGRSITHVKNRLELAEASLEVKAEVDAKRITIWQAQEIVKSSDGNADEQKKALEEAKTRRKRNKLTITMGGGVVKYGGFKSESCSMIAAYLIDDEFKQAIISAGYDPDTLRISVERAAE